MKLNEPDFAQGLLAGTAWGSEITRREIRRVIAKPLRELRRYMCESTPAVGPDRAPCDCWLCVNIRAIDKATKKPRAK